TLAKLISRTKTKVIVREAAFLGREGKINLKLRLYGFIYKFSKKVIALSQGVKENLVERYHVHRDKIEVIYNTVDLAYIDKAKEEAINDDYASIFLIIRIVNVSACNIFTYINKTLILRAYQTYV